MNYDYAMQGMGADVTWTMQINIAGFSRDTVQQYASEHLKELNYVITSGLEPGIEMNTEMFPGEFGKRKLKKESSASSRNSPARISYIANEGFGTLNVS